MTQILNQSQCMYYFWLFTTKNGDVQFGLKHIHKIPECYTYNTSDAHWDSHVDKAAVTKPLCKVFWDFVKEY